MTNEQKRVIANIIGMVIAGIIIAAWLADRRERMWMHDEVIKMEATKGQR